MNGIKYLTLILFVINLSFSAQAQKTSVYQDANNAYKRGIGFYEKGLFGIAQKEFLKVLAQTRPTNEGTPSLLLKEKAYLYEAMCTIRLDRPDGERLVLDFIRKHEPSSIADEAKYEIANYYYNDEQYDNAIVIYNTIDLASVSEEKASEVQFKKAYSYFLRKKFDQARAGFKTIRENKDKYYYPSNYYYGVCSFFNDDYEDALSAFKRANKSKKYSKVVPYYIAQIHFAREEYTQLITYAEPIAEDKTIKYNREINQLIGQSYFELGKYDKALPYLENYVDEIGKLTEKEIYQLAYTQYKTENFEAAIQNFEEIKEVNSEFGQNAVYNLADSYLKAGRKNTARSAFQTAAKMNYDPVIQAACRFNYAKLSYELNYDRDAISTLQQITPESSYYGEAQSLLSKIFMDTRDYTKTMEIIEQMPNRTPPIDEVYQKVVYNRGVQLYNDGDIAGASELFNKSLNYSYDIRSKALAIYWLGEIDYHAGRFDASINNMGQYISLAKTINNIPDEASIATANYTMGYNYLKKHEYATASRYFEEAVQALKSRPSGNEYVNNQLLPDASLRTADCYFKINNYNKAAQNYDVVINSRYDGFDYAMYQKSIILGLQSTEPLPVDKILLLEDLYKNNPSSYYADDALFSLGLTYLKKEKFNNAAEMFSKMITQYPQSDLTNPALLKLGLIYVNLGEIDKGLEYYKRVFANNPDSQTSKDALNGIEDIYIETGNADDYFIFLESVPGYQVSEMARDSVLFKAAESQYAGGQYEKSIEAYSKYLKKFPDGPNSLVSYFKRAESYFALKQYESAQEDYEQVLSRGQSKFKEISARNAALITYNVHKDFSKSYTLFQKYLESASTEENKHEAELGALRSAYRSKNTSGVFTAAELIMANKKSTKAEKGEANYNKAKLAFDTKQYEIAREAFNKVIKYAEDVRAAEARYMIAYIYYLERDLEIAQQLCLNTNQQITAYEYWLAKSVLLLADIFVDKGDTFNAKASLESILENYTGDPEIIQSAKEKLAKINAGTNSKVTTPPDEDANLEMDAPIDDQN